MRSHGTLRSLNPRRLTYFTPHRYVIADSSGCTTSLRGWLRVPLDPPDMPDETEAVLVNPDDIEAVLDMPADMDAVLDTTRLTLSVNRCFFFASWAASAAGVSVSGSIT